MAIMSTVVGGCNEGPLGPIWTHISTGESTHTMRTRVSDDHGRDGPRAARAAASVPSGGAPDRPFAGSAGRGQTTLDFAIGMSLFLVVLLGMLLFVTGTMQPFTQGSQEDIGVADRVADSLAEGLLGDPAKPHVADTTCTVEFFDDNSPSYCRHDGPNLTSRVGVKSWQLVNVTMQANLTADDGEEILCWDDSNEKIVHRGSGDCDRAFVIGSNPPAGSGNTVTSRRIVTVEKVDATLRVEVW